MLITLSQVEQACLDKEPGTVSSGQDLKRKKTGREGWAESVVAQEMSDTFFMVIVVKNNIYVVSWVTPFFMVIVVK